MWSIARIEACTFSCMFIPFFLRSNVVILHLQDKRDDRPDENLLYIFLRWSKREMGVVRNGSLDFLSLCAQSQLSLTLSGPHSSKSVPVKCTL